MGFNISVVAGTTAATSSVTAYGFDAHIITDHERESFTITNKPLKEAVKAYKGKKPDDVYVHSPTPWGDLYEKYGWAEVETILIVKSAEVLGVSSEPVIVSTQTFTNTSSKTATFNAAIQDQVTNTVEHSWSSTDAIEISQSFTYEVGFLGTGAGGETSMSYSHEWGQSKTESESITVGSTSGVEVTLEPGESVQAQLIASRGKMQVRITYMAYLSGQTAVNYDDTYQGHHFYGLNINNVMEADNLPTTMKFTEDIEIGYYSNTTIKVIDANQQVKATYSPADQAAPANQE